MCLNMCMNVEGKYLRDKYGHDWWSRKRNHEGCLIIQMMSDSEQSVRLRVEKRHLDVPYWPLWGLRYSYPCLQCRSNFHSVAKMQIRSWWEKKWDQRPKNGHSRKIPSDVWRMREDKKRAVSQREAALKERFVWFCLVCLFSEGEEKCLFTGW